MNSFKLIRIDSYGISTYSCNDAFVDYSPKIKYRLEKKNAFDPALISRRDAYREDTFEIELILYPEDYNALLYFLTRTGKFYLESRQSSAIKQYPVEIEQLPKSSDDLLDFPDKIKFTLVSRYTTIATHIDHNYHCQMDEDDYLHD